MQDDLRDLPAAASAAVPDLAGRVVMVVGATGGLGGAVTRALAASGAQLILAARQVVKLEQLADAVETGGGPVPVLYPVDLSGARAADYDQMAAAIRTECGGLDAVVHAAARFAGLTPLAHIGEERWQETQCVNVAARFLIDQAALGLLRDRSGRILHAVDSLARAGHAYWGPYGASQFALRGLLAIEASEYEDEGVTVAAMLPPPMRTRLRAAAYVSEEVERAAAPEAVAPAVCRLLDPAAALERGVAYRLTAGVDGNGSP